jgi:serine/threonine protein kinase
VSGASTTAPTSGDRARPRIGRYVITARIGRGGMGMVYRGHDEVLDRDVAVKTLALDGNFDEDSRKRFEVEAKAAAKLQHPNIVTVFELGQERSIPYIAMELLPGYDLETLLRSNEAMLLAEKLDIMAQVCRGLHYAHERHVIHRDVKPSNIRLLDDGSVKIMDFGIAKIANTNLTRTGMMVGTVHYMCPEQIQGQSVDGRSDVFSVGVILFELLAGRRPFEGAPGNATEVLYKIVQEPTPALPDLGAHTAALQEIVNRALAKVPDQRYATAGRLADDLAELRARLDASVSPPTQVLETIQAARQLMSQGRIDEGVTRLRQAVETTPQSIDARRALRAACREAAHRTGTKEPEADFPELTLHAGATHLQQTSLMDSPTTAIPERPPVRPPAETAAEGKTLLIAGAIVLGFALVAGVLLLLRPSPGTHDGPGEAVTPRPGSTVASTTLGEAMPVESTHVEKTPVGAEHPRTPLATAAPARSVRLKLSTEPSGAAVTLDGKALAGRTPVDVDIDPRQPHQASFILDGYAPRRIPIAAGESADVNVALVVSGPPGRVNVVSSYPVDVLLNEAVLAKSQPSPSVNLPPGRHQLRVQSAKVALRMTPTVEVKSGETVTISVPPLGQLNVQAYPDVCKVFVDGFPFGDVPILREPVASGSHTVLFKWPDGTQDEQAIDVPPGGAGYATGKKN